MSDPSDQRQSGQACHSRRSPPFTTSRSQHVFRETRAYSGFAVDGVEAAKAFFGQTLGLDVRESHDQLELHIAGGTKVLIYPKEDHDPASFTILNFPSGPC